MTTSQPFDLRLPTPGCYNDPERAGLDAKSVFDGMTEHLFFTLGNLAPTASRHDLYMALSYAVRDRLMMRYLATTEAMRARPQKSVAYLSAEFLIGPQLNSNLLNLGIQKEAEEALKNFGIESLQQILHVEEEAHSPSHARTQAQSQGPGEHFCFKIWPQVYTCFTIFSPLVALSANAGAVLTCKN